MNVFLFYGEHITHRFSELAKSWETMLDINDWGNCCFVFVSGTEPELTELPEHLRLMIVNRIFTTPQLADDAGNNIGNWVAGLGHDGGTFLLHCICSEFGQSNVNGNELKRFINSFRQFFSLAPHPVVYLMLTHNDHMRQHQIDFVKALYADDFEHYASTYLLSDFSANMCIVSEREQLRILSCELALIVKKNRILLFNHTYSLGYSVLNANSSELDHLERETIISEWLDVAIARPMLGVNQLWRMISTTQPMPTSLDRATLFSLVREWVERVMGQPSFPNEEERENNRILGALYDPRTNEAQMQSHILAFYKMNFDLKRYEQSAQNYFSDWLNSLQHDPYAFQLNNPHTIGLLRAICDVLRDLASIRLEPQYSAMPTKRFCEQHKAYAKRCCKEIEQATMEYCKNMAVRVMAQEMLNYIQYVVNFVENVQDPQQTIHALGFDHFEYVALQQKYAPLHQQMKNDLAVNQTYGQLLTRQGAPLFSEEGQPLSAGWEQLLGEAVHQLQTNMHTGHQTFLDRLKDAFPNAAAFGNFIDRYVCAPVCILRYAGAVDGAQTKYLLDIALQTHPWTGAIDALACIVRTDNIERVDCVALQNRMADLIEINNQAVFPYFIVTAQTDQTVQPSRPVEIDQHNQPVEEIAPAAQQPAQVQANGRTDMNIRLNRTPINNRLNPLDFRYTLHWTWPALVTQMFVTMTAQDVLLANSYRVDMNCPVDVGTFIYPSLPYGCIQVSITGFRNDGTQCQDSAYVCGRRDTIYYQVTAASGTLELLTSTGFMDQLLFLSVRPDGSKVAYPLRPIDEGRYRGLTLPVNNKLMVNPSIKFPCIETQLRQ